MTQLSASGAALDFQKLEPLWSDLSGVLQSLGMLIGKTISPMLLALGYQTK
jgi:hypothetical protein